VLLRCRNYNCKSEVTFSQSAVCVCVCVCVCTSLCVQVITPNSSRGTLKEFPGKSFSDKYHKPCRERMYCEPKIKDVGYQFFRDYPL